MNRPAEALREFETTLKAAPERLNALYGAARAAQLAGDKTRAARYFARLLENCPEPEVDMPQLAEARAFLAAYKAERAAYR